MGPVLIDIVVVLRAEDAVLDFLSVLNAPQGHEVHVLCGDIAQQIALPAESGLTERLALLAGHVGPVDEAAASPGPEALAALIERSAADRPARLWTHSPADIRRSRGLLGRDAAAAGHGLPVHHAVGYSPFLQFISDLDRPLDRARIRAKLDFVNRHCGHLLRTESPQHRIAAAPDRHRAGPGDRTLLHRRRRRTRAVVRAAREP